MDRVIALAIAFFFGGFILGIGCGSSVQINDDADNSISDNPSPGWKVAVFKAELRKQERGGK